MRAENREASEHQRDQNDCCHYGAELQKHRGWKPPEPCEDTLHQNESANRPRNHVFQSLRQWQLTFNVDANANQANADELDAESCAGYRQKSLRKAECAACQTHDCRG